MAEINPTLPIFFNMHNTSHSGPFTFFPSAQSCKIFADHKPDKVDKGLWHTQWCFLKEAPAQTSTSLSGKRPAPSESRLPLLSKRQQSIDLKLLTSEILDLTEDPPSFNIPDKEQLEDTSDLHTATSDSLSDEGSDSVPRAKTGYSANYLNLPYTLPGGFQITRDSTMWKKSDAFRAARPLLLERIRKDYASIKDPLEVHGALTRHLVKLANILRGSIPRFPIQFPLVYLVFETAVLYLLGLEAVAGEFSLR
ncbi:hypothetical protein LIER_06325 [Lithospermum erythrorhizon]|uniref:Uncharacterized protein n=1 Tax=Lithospermum erythrorhizon TaxID=34254 RepID=A0AAV3P4D7_LITER